MNNTEITSILIEQLNLETAYVTGDNNHIKIITVGNIFQNASQVKRQQIVYTPLMNMIKEKQIHAVSIIAYTPKEWEQNNNVSDSCKSL